MPDKDPTTLTASQIAAMSDNEDVLKAHPEQNVFDTPYDKPAEFALDLSDNKLGYGTLGSFLLGQI